MARSKDMKTPLARVAFANTLYEPQDRDNGKKQYGCSLLWTKGTDLSALQQLVLEVITEEWGDKAKQMFKDGLIKNPFLDGDSKQGKNKSTGEYHPGFEGTTFIRVTSGEGYPPKLFDQKVKPVVGKDEIYSGCYVYAVVNAFTWENKENGKGVTFGVSLIQKAKDGERLGGGGAPNPEAFFESVASDDAPEETKGGKGAGGLFD